MAIFQMHLLLDEREVGKVSKFGRVRLKPDGTRAETRFRLSPKRASPFKSAGASVQSTAGSRGARISVSNSGYTTFRGSVRVLATHSIRQFPLTSPPVRHRLPSGFKRTLLFYLGGGRIFRTIFANNSWQHITIIKPKLDSI